MEDSANKTDGSSIENTTETATPKAKKAAKQKAKIPRPKSTHPPTSEMVIAAIKGLKDRKGSSLQAIRKYVVATYIVDGEKITPFIKKYLKNAVSNGTVVQTRGKGASGSFKLSTEVKSGGGGGGAKTKAKRVAKEEKINDKSVEKKIATTAHKTETSATKKAKMPTKKSKTSTKKTESAKKPNDKKKPKVAATKDVTAVAATATATATAAVAATTAVANKKITEKTAQPKTLSKTKKTVKSPASKTKTPKPKRATTKNVPKNSKMSG